ncbi:MAG: hypothetical protein DMF90_07030, partial [Acidobacteria bacterium]
MRVGDDVVHDRTIARFDLDRLNPLVFGQVGRDADVLIGNGTLGRYFELLGHREDRIRLADRPAIREPWHRGQIAFVAFRGTAVHPCDDGVDILLRQPRVVLERSGRIVCRPRRHLTLGDTLLDRAGPGP